MSFTAWANARVKRLDWLDVALTKLAVFFFALALVRRWKGLLRPGAGWYWLAFLLAALRPMWRANLKGDDGV